MIPTAMEVFFKTRVYKFRDRWVVDYHYPMSGRLCVDYGTWEEAITEACAIEKDKEWVW